MHTWKAHKKSKEAKKHGIFKWTWRIVQISKVAIAKNIENHSRIKNDKTLSLLPQLPWKGNEKKELETSWLVPTKIKYINFLTGNREAKP